VETNFYTQQENFNVEAGEAFRTLVRKVRGAASWLVNDGSVVRNIGLRVELDAERCEEAEKHLHEALGLFKEAQRIGLEKAKAEWERKHPNSDEC